MMIEHRCDRVGDVDDLSRVTRHNKEEAVGRLEDEMFEFLVGEKGWLVGAIVVGIARAPQ